MITKVARLNGQTFRLDDPQEHAAWLRAEAADERVKSAGGSRKDAGWLPPVDTKAEQQHKRPSLDGILFHGAHADPPELQPAGATVRSDDTQPSGARRSLNEILFGARGGDEPTVKTPTPADDVTSGQSITPVSARAEAAWHRLNQSVDTGSIQEMIDACFAVAESIHELPKSAPEPMVKRSLNGILFGARGG